VDGVLGHDDRRFDAQDLRRQGHALCMVARREGHHTAPPLFGIELEQSVHRPSDLE